MRDDYKQIEKDFSAIHDELVSIANKIEESLIDTFGELKHVDKISCRAKSLDSFLKKALKTNKDGSLKYKVPIKEVQDLIGARIVVYYKSDFKEIKEVVTKYFNRVEAKTIVPDDVYKFGYEGEHFICFIPNAIYHNSNPIIPDFFELQIKTLYQHAWSQANHGLGYKPGSTLTYEEERKLAFLAAQSWGADTVLMEMINSKN